MEHREQTVEELKSRLRLCAQKSNRRKSALKSLMKSHELLQYQFNKICEDNKCLLADVLAYKAVKAQKHKKWWQLSF